MRKRSTGLLPFSAESEGERVICPDRAGSEGIEIDAPKGCKNGWIRCTARGMLVAGTFQGTSQMGETQAAQGVRALLKEVPLSPPEFSRSPWKQGLFCCCCIGHGKGHSAADCRACHIAGAGAG